jgi:predicted DNA-binding protein (MmcQ/YjbR family)
VAERDDHQSAQRPSLTVAFDAAQIRAVCLAIGPVTADFPFDAETEVFRIAGKMFALLNEKQQSVNLKCDPVLAELLRQRFAAVTPGYHQNKRHWNTLILDGTVPDDEVLEMVRQSYSLVFAGLPRRERERIAG